MDAEHERKSQQFRKIFAYAANELNKNEAHSLFYTYSGTSDLPASYTDTVPMVLHLFRSLEKKGLLSPDYNGLHFLEDMLLGIGRVDIVRGCERLLKGRYWWNFIPADIPTCYEYFLQISN